MTHKLAYRVHAGNGPYLALMHGFLSSNAQWMRNLTALSQICRPVTIELWGHGDSPAPTDTAFYRPEAYVEQLEQIRRQLGCEQWFLCGYSLGAGLTIRYSHTYPEHVVAHLLTNSQSAFAGEDTLKKWRQELPEAAAKIREQGEPAIRRLAVHPRFARRLPEDVFTALNLDAARLSPTAIANTLETTNMQASIRAIAATNPKPAQLCFGKYERRFAAAKDWASQHMAHLNVVELEAGHGVNMEDAPGFNKAVAQFITEHG